MKTLPVDFYARPVLEVARELIGCVLVHGRTAGVIVETEAYHQSEPACHAFVGLTRRTEPLFGPPGRAYVYRSYGIHALFNAVCEEQGTGAAVLVRALEPTAGLARMFARRPLAKREIDLCSGPGKLTQALDIELVMNAADLQHGQLVIQPRPAEWQEPSIVTGPRVGITRATELMWRFAVKANPYVSMPRMLSI